TRGRRSATWRLALVAIATCCASEVRSAPVTALGRRVSLRFGLAPDAPFTCSRGESGRGGSPAVGGLYILIIPPQAVKAATPRPVTPGPGQPPSSASPAAGTNRRVNGPKPGHASGSNSTPAVAPEAPVRDLGGAGARPGTQEPGAHSPVGTSGALG